MREEAEKKASFLYMGNHRDLLRDIKAFESFCRVRGHTSVTCLAFD
jgi:hypothetical protein